MKEVSYFPHDCDARNDPKIEKMIRRHGWQTYGLFWAIVENLYRQGGGIDADFDHIAYTLRAELEIIKQVVEESGLFLIDKDGMVRSNGVDERIGRMKLRSDMAAEAGRRSVEVRAAKSNIRSTAVEQPFNHRSTAVEQPFNHKIKENQIKENQTKEDKNKGGRSAPPSIDDVKGYCSGRSNGVDPEAFVDYYQARGWKYGPGKPMVDWQAAVRTWEKRRKADVKGRVVGGAAPVSGKYAD